MLLDTFVGSVGADWCVVSQVPPVTDGGLLRKGDSRSLPPSFPLRQERVRQLALTDHDGPDDDRG